MALGKTIIQSDGVPTSYHRISFLQLTTNHHNSIVVVSYVDAQARENEKTSVLTKPYQGCTTYELPYDPTMSIDAAYGYLKTLPQFDGAADI